MSAAEQHQQEENEREIERDREGEGEEKETKEKVVVDDDEEIRESWNKKARLWRQHVGTEGDWNRRLNSDPYLWKYLGEVTGLRVVDAGCGSGYLAHQLLAAGAAQVVAVDLSPAMIDIACADRQQKIESQQPADEVESQQPADEASLSCSLRINWHQLIFRVDDCQKLATFPAEQDGSFDVVVSNYVLMDLPDVEQALRQFHRLLKVGGRLLFVILHPCFPGPDLPSPLPGRQCQLLPFPSYFVPHREDYPPWGHFQDIFIGYHRPLSFYFHACFALGFRLLAFDEPHLTPDRHHLLPPGPAGEKMLFRSSQRPYSVIFHLIKE